MKRELTAAEQNEQGLKEAVRLRPHRIRNYRIKFAAGPPVCGHEGCPADSGLVVVRVKQGDTDDCFSVRCFERHVGRFEVLPGQFPDRRLEAA